MLINLRDALMAGKRLPYDAEVEFLESTGTQFIDTGVIPTTDLEFELHVKFSALLTKTGQVPMGFQYAQGLQWRYMVSNYPYLGTSTTYSYASFFNDQRCYAAKRGTLEYTFSLKNGVFSNGIGNDTQISMSGTPPITPIPDNWTIYLFKGNQINEWSDPFTGRIYSLKFWRNGILVRDFIPVRKKTVGYLYDRVSGKLFGNAGTGDFVLGPDVVPVEWLQTDGNAYIIGKLPRTIADASWGSIKFSLPLGNMGTDQRMFTLVDNSRNRMLYVGNGWDGMYYAFAGGIACVPNYYFNRWRVSDLSRETTHTVQFSRDALLLDGIVPYNTIVTWTAYNVSNATGFELFRNSNGVASTSPHRFEGFDIADANGKALAILPVRVGTGSTWEGATMDVLTRRIYRNAGTGAFTYGNDLKYPIPAE